MVKGLELFGPQKPRRQSTVLVAGTDNDHGVFLVGAVLEGRKCKPKSTQYVHSCLQRLSTMKRRNNNNNNNNTRRRLNCSDKLELSPRVPAFLLSHAERKHQKGVDVSMHAAQTPAAVLSTDSSIYRDTQERASKTHTTAV